MSNEFGLFINDSNETPRLKIYVDKENTPKIELLDENGSTLKQ